MEAGITGYAPPFVAGFLEEERTGTVLMANSAGIYLRFGGQLLLLCDKRWGQVPIGIGIADFAQNTKALALSAGDPAACREGNLHFLRGWIKITEIRVTSAAPGEVSPSRLQEGVRSLRGREKGLAPLASRLLEDASPEEKWNSWCSLACPQLENLLRGIGDGDAAAIHAAVTRLLGLGPGLTPSADDILCGMLYALLRSPAADLPSVRTLKDAICQEADSRTHPVSAAYLKAIAQGEYFSRMEDVWLSLTNRGDAYFDALLEVGSCSGADMLLGLLLAGKLLTRMEEGINGCADRSRTMG